MNIRHILLGLTAAASLPFAQAETVISTTEGEGVIKVAPAAMPRKSTFRLAQATPPAAPSPAGVPALPAPPPPAVVAAESSAVAEWANSVAMAATDRAMGGFFGSKARKPLIVSTSERDSKALAQIEEDLNVMMRILEKAANSRDDSKVMGIDVFALGGANSPRVFHIDGYGAMFLLKVKYPLLAPPAKDDQPRTTADTNSEWERARQEVYGRPRSEERGFMREGPAEEFDADRVEKLKNSIIEDLGNATHIRDLKSDEWVTVVVTGGAARMGGGSGVARYEGKGSRAGAVAVNEYSKSSGSDAPQSTMTVRAKKSDIDSFGKGKMKSEEFRKKVSVQIY